ncbi:unnamed protein product [Blepharisma stoltei]|uniref:Uncharacterized protein n=1 Tax=Blepharisma stoltei TaxID=1481888 RepID=A0AAU9JI20_9CILI|nr:unnamed protein product [Blepharisma stoltei]
MNITHNEEMLILVPVDSSINIWKWRKNIRLHTIRGIKPSIVRISITEDDKFILGYTRDGKIRFSSLETFNQICWYKFESMVNASFVSG